MNMSVSTSANNNEFSRYIPLHQAAIQGKWAKAKEFFAINGNGVAYNEIIKCFGETALHMAVCAGRSERSKDFVKNLVDMMSPEALEIANLDGHTALHLAAWVGNLEAVKIICGKGLSSVYIRDNNGFSPLDLAASNAMKDTLSYLLREVTKNDRRFETLFPDEEHCEEHAALLLASVITTGYYDIALYLVDKYPRLAVSKQKEKQEEEKQEEGKLKDGDCGLKALARNVSAFKSGNRHKWWQRAIYDHVPAKLNDSRIRDYIETDETQATAQGSGDIENPRGANIQATAQGSGDIENPGGTNQSTTQGSGDIENPGGANQATTQATAQGSGDIENPRGANQGSGDIENQATTQGSGDIENSGGANQATTQATAQGSGDIENPGCMNQGSGDQIENQATAQGSGDTENPGGVNQATGQKCNWARPLVEYFCNWAQQLVDYFFISVPWIKHIQEQKEKHLQARKLLERLCEGVSSLKYSNLHASHVDEAMSSAAKLGIHEVIEEIVKWFPMHVWAGDEKGRNLIQIAVIERHANVFNLIYQMGDARHIMMSPTARPGTPEEERRNNLLHMVGAVAPPNKLNEVAGAALKMQRELQWFQEVKKLAKPTDEECRNHDGQTPKMLFTKKHEDLVVAGEKWMKDTANSCTIPSALIVTIVFAAAIAVPGGINNIDGLPIFSKEAAFKIFVFFDAISLFSATTSLLVVLSILTSRYDEDDFLFVLPNRLIIGLATLFLSITAMLIAFSSALYLLFGTNDTVWIVYPVVALALIPIFSFTFLQFPLLLDLISSTYCPRIFGKQSNRPFYGDGT